MIYFYCTKMIGTGPTRIFIIRREFAFEFQWGPFPPQRSLEAMYLILRLGHTSWDCWASTGIRGSRPPALWSFRHSRRLSQGLLSEFIKVMDYQPNRCRNLRGSLTCHFELMNLFLQVCETEEFIQHSLIQQVCIEWLWCTGHCSKHWGPSKEQARPLDTCLSRHRHLLLDLGRCGWEQPGVDLAPGKVRGGQMLHCNLSCSVQISILDSMVWKLHLKMQMIFPYKDRKPCPPMTHLSAAQ